MKKVLGNTYSIKDFIKSKGGKWNSQGKHWEVPDENYDEVMKKIPQKEYSGQLWEECPRCGREPVYLSLDGYCERCG